MYPLDIFNENITDGRYRIKTDFIEEKQYIITAEFKITRDKSLLQKSELDFDDFKYSREIDISYECYDISKIYRKEMDFPVHVYKNEKTYDTTIVINGDEYYKIAKGTGKWGIVTCSLYTAYDENKFLIYSFSREDNNKKQSYIGIFDLIDKKEIYRSEAYETYDIWVSYRAEEDIFETGFMEYEEYEGGGSSSISAPGEIGYYKYENRIFNFSNILHGKLG